MSSIFNDPEWEQQRKEILSDWARRDGEVKVDMGETEEYMPAEEFLALRQKYPNGNMRLSEPQEAAKVFKDKGLPLPAELSFAGSVKPIFGQEDAYNGSSSFPAETFNFPANTNEGYQAGLGFSPVVSAMQVPEKYTPKEKGRIIYLKNKFKLKDEDLTDENIKKLLLPDGDLWAKYLSKQYYYMGLLERFFKTNQDMAEEYLYNNKGLDFFLSILKSSPATFSMIKSYLSSDKSLYDKYNHAVLSCRGAQYSPFISNSLGYLKEWNDNRNGQSLSENHADLNADDFGNEMGRRYPDKDCEEIIAPFIPRSYPKTEGNQSRTKEITFIPKNYSLKKK